MRAAVGDFRGSDDGAARGLAGIEIDLHLPSSLWAPSASPELLRDESASAGIETRGFAPWKLPAVRLAAADALDFLFALPVATGPDVVTGTDEPIGGGAVIGPSIAYWSRLGKLALELVARGRVVPALEPASGAAGARAAEATGGNGDHLARWLPVTTAPRDRERLERLELAMPPVCRARASSANGRMVGDDAADGHRDGAGMRGTSARMVLDDALAVLCDACARRALGGRRDVAASASQSRSERSPAEAWINALFSADPAVHADSAACATLAESLTEWSALKLSREENESPFRLCLRLTEPEPADSDEPSEEGEDGSESEMGAEREGEGDAQAEVEARAGAEIAADGQATHWRLDFLLQATDDPTLLVPAETVWRERGETLSVVRRTLDLPHEFLLGELGRALRLVPSLEPALRTATPAGLDLDTSGAHRFLREAAPLLEEAGFGVLVPSWVGHAPRVALRLNASPARQTESSSGLLGLGAVLDYEWRVALGDEDLSLAELRALARMKEPLVRHRGRWVELRGDEIEAALDLASGARASGRMTAVEALRAGMGLEAAPGGLPVAGFDAGGWLDRLIGDSGTSRVEAVKAPEGFRGTLRPYQERGLAWLAFLDRLGLGACLADDMGLGKTIQLLALLVAEREGRLAAGEGGEDECDASDGGDAGGEGDEGEGSDAVDDGDAGNPAHADDVPDGGRPAPTLVVCPMSVVGNWQKEAERFAPSLRVHVHHGSDRLGGDALRDGVAGMDIVITTYGLAARDREALEAVDWGRVVLDEAQNVKNSAAKQTRAVRSFRAQSRIALTGTPVENRLSELHSILTFLNPGLLGSANDFKKRFATPIEKYRDERAARTLTRVTRPFILRRLKTDRSIIRDLPEKVEMKVYCNLTREQASLYQAVIDDMLSRVADSEGMERRGLVLATMMKLKQVCNHPAQFARDGSGLDGRSGKLARLEEVLEEALATGDRTLIFTQFSEMGELLRSHLQRRLGREVLFLHGGTARKARERMIARFQGGNGGPPVFVLSLKAGGTGLNLTAANQVVHFDRWWNPAVEDQATDRAFRIGQRKNVQVRKLVCAGTLEERIDQVIERKKELSERIVGSGEGWLTELSTAELRDVVALAGNAVSE